MENDPIFTEIKNLWIDCPICKYNFNYEGCGFCKNEQINLLEFIQSTEFDEDLIENLTIDCPDCPIGIEDDQYTCTTCWCQGGNGTINVLI